MKLIIICFLHVLLASSIICLTDEDGPVVEIEDGKVLGTVNTTIGQNTTYYAFRGIPFAKPPVGDLRFAAPEKNEKWNDTLDATQDKEECVQGSDPVTGSEDCLYINIYTPTLESKNLSVMVWIYGGSFSSGNSSYVQNGPDYFLDENVVFVAAQYRVGVFGFLSTEDTICPGNWGLKDQVLALKWVQENIAYFGGNPDNVTIFGESAGSVSVSYLLQTNATKGLYHAAIMQSGTSLNLWALNTRASQIAYAVGVLFGEIFTSNSTILLEKLRSLDYETLQSKADSISGTIVLTNALRGLPFSPVIEPVHDDALFTSNSDQLLREGGFIKVPVIIGYNSNEAAAVGQFTFLMRIYLLNYDVEIPLLTPYGMTSSLTKKALIGPSIKLHYYGILPIAASTENILKHISDDQFNRPINEAAKQMSNYTTVYKYVFSHEGILSGITDRDFTGVGHAEDVQYIFRSSNNYTDADVLTRSRLVRMWTNFAKYGNPTPTAETLLQNITWPIVNGTNGNITYLNINTTLEVKNNANSDGIEFFEDIYDSYGDKNYTTY